MNNYFVDLHVHIGRAGDGSPVKITAARSLTVANILEECLIRKGIDLVGIVDASSPKVRADLAGLVKAGLLQEIAGGGLRYKQAVTLILGAEVETTDRVPDRTGIRKDRNAHCLCYFPRLSQLRAFSEEMSRPGKIKNPQLSSQKCHLPLQGLWELVNGLGGILIPAHAFTPHKGIYGSCVRRVREILSPQAWAAIPAVELGLSADSYYADMVAELAGKTFLSNSDAHSLSKIGREYNLVRMREPTYNELVLALRREGGRAVVGNFGFDPKLGKYHRTYCEKCRLTAHDSPPVTACPRCGAGADGRRVVMGVLDRIYQIRDGDQPAPPDHRPLYRHQIPLENLPGIGRQSLRKLLAAHTEMEVLHKLSLSELQQVAGGRPAELIVLAREGKLELVAGGGGHYGRVAGPRSPEIRIKTGDS